MFDTYQILDVVGTIIGLIYIYQEYKASIWLWLTGIIMPLVYTFVYYEAGLYADFGMQIYYTLAAITDSYIGSLGKRKETMTRKYQSRISPRSWFCLLFWFS